MKILYLVMVSLIVSCATTYAIETKPSGSKVFSGKKLIGATPLQFISSDVSLKEAGGVLIRIEAEGHQGVYLWLPDDAEHHRLTFNLTPFLRRERTEVAVGALEIDRPVLYRLSESLLHLQMSLMTGSEKEKAEISKEIARLKTSNPTFGSVYFLDALRLLREGNKEAGKKSLMTALKFAPNEYDFLALLNEVGGDVEARQASSGK